MAIWVIKTLIVYFCVFLQPLNIFCSVRPITIAVLCCAHLSMKYSLGISNFLEEISSLPHSIVFLYCFALFTLEGFLISPCYSLELCIQMGLSFLFFFAFLFSSFSLFVRPPQATIRLLACFSWGWSWSLPPVWCYKPPSIVFWHFIRSNPLNIFVTFII